LLKQTASQKRPLLLKPLCLLVALVVSSCAVFESGDKDAPLTEDVGKFSDLNQGGRLPKAWQVWRITPQKNNTEYTLKKHEGKTVLHADANMAASGLVLPLKPRAAKDLFLTWEWKALSYIPGADNSDSHRDDAPLRILVAFDGDKSTLPLRDQMVFELA